MKIRKNGRDTDGRFVAGNAGRPLGARHRTTLAIESLLDGEAEKLTRKAIELALGGDTVALRLCLERIAPPRKGRTVTFDIPDMRTSADILCAIDSVLRATANGALTPEEASSVVGLVEIKRRAVETAEIEVRLAALEKGK